MKILITGSSGMLGLALCRELSGKHEVTGMDLKQLLAFSSQLSAFVQCDITDKQKTISIITEAHPDLVIHCAAYTDVDGCESDSARADQVNAQGTENVVLAAQDAGAVVYYLGSDYVFDGEKKTAYLESDRTNPINSYGQSKLAGERYIQSNLNKYVIIRSSWLFGPGGGNFVESIINQAQQQRNLKVVNDQFGSPTYTQDLAQGITRLIAQDAAAAGIYHITNSGNCSWYQLAQAIKESLGLRIEIAPVSSEQYLRPARRPRMSILENMRFRQTCGELRPWPEALKEYLNERNRIEK
ncbi:dTDP-4-dehydrorhamnose reductase [Candidatus Omnitrophota bacterium]